MCRQSEYVEDNSVVRSLPARAVQIPSNQSIVRIQTGIWFFHFCNLNFCFMTFGVYVTVFVVKT